MRNIAGHTSNETSWARSYSPKRRRPNGSAETDWHCTPACSVSGTKKIFALAERHLDSEDRNVRNLSRALFLQFERFFTFLREEGVEPTNNSAERALRPAVQWRKTSFGSRSPEGEVAVARLLTVAHTCRLRNLQPLAFLTAAIRDHRKALPSHALALQITTHLNCYDNSNPSGAFTATSTALNFAPICPKPQLGLRRLQRLPNPHRRVPRQLRCPRET